MTHMLLPGCLVADQACQIVDLLCFSSMLFLNYSILVQPVNLCVLLSRSCEMPNDIVPFSIFWSKRWLHFRQSEELFCIDVFVKQRIMKTICKYQKYIGLSTIWYTRSYLYKKYLIIYSSCPFLVEKVFYHESANSY